MERIEVFVALGMGVLHRHPRAELDMLPDRLSEGLVGGHANRIERGQVQLDEALPLGFGNLEMTMHSDQCVESAEFPGKAVGSAEGFGGKCRQMVDVVRSSFAEERLEQGILEHAGIECLLQPVQRIETTGVFEECWYSRSSLLSWSPPCCVTRNEREHTQSV